MFSCDLFAFVLRLFCVCFAFVLRFVASFVATGFVEGGRRAIEALYGNGTAGND